tara:strand:+ start:43 stop:657 length:615 start_codon:yes stop_codon:yes gene_type:complete
MSKINIDLSTKVDLECREGDDFVFELDLTSSNTNTVFELNESYGYFTVYNSLKQPIFIVSGNGNISNTRIPILSTSYFPGSGDFISVNNEAIKHAKALINLINATEQDFHFTKISDYIVKLSGHVGGVVLVVGSETENLHAAGVAETLNGLTVKVKANRFNLPENLYTYDFRIVSDIRSDESKNDFYYKNSQTFLFGKLKVTKN